MINSSVFVVHETISKLESHDLVDPVICRCRKHQQILLSYQGGLVNSRYMCVAVGS
jgi:hypothetical protein